jgi:hypothetical protein
VVNEGLDLVSNEELKMDFPLLVFKEKTSTEFMLIQFDTPAYHLGQVNYHRRLLNR